MTAVHGVAEDFDPLAPAFAGAFYPELARLREEHPVARSACYGGFVVLTRYDDVSSSAKDWKHFSSASGVGAVPSDGDFRFLLIESDPPAHTEIRRLLAPLFLRAAAQRHEPRIRRQAAELLDPLSAGGRCEFVRDFALPFPSRVVYEEIVGAPREGLEQVLGWLYDVVARPAESAAARDSLADWAGSLLAERAATAPRDDVVQRLLDGPVDGRKLTPHEQANVLGLMILGAIDNTANTLGTMLHLLATRPGLAADLRGSPDLLDSAIEEVLRLEPSTPALGRTATEDVTVGGEQIRAGERVVLYYAAANRDPRVFPDPDTLDPARHPNQHLSFGLGIHRCIGRHIARLELRVALEEILSRWADIELDPADSPAFRHGLSRGFERLPLRFRAARGGRGAQ